MRIVNSPDALRTLYAPTGAFLASYLWLLMNELISRYLLIWPTPLAVDAQPGQP